MSDRGQISYCIVNGDWSVPEARTAINASVSREGGGPSLDGRRPDQPGREGPGNVLPVPAGQMVSVTVRHRAQRGTTAAGTGRIAARTAINYSLLVFISSAGDELARWEDASRDQTHPQTSTPGTGTSAGFWLGGINAPLPREAKKILKI